MIEAAETLYGPYPWGQYDILVLPPSFPFGGMENPRLTFATPTVLAGDRSLVSLVAHELAPRRADAPLLRGGAEAADIRLRQVDPSAIEVLADVAKEVRELEGDPEVAGVRRGGG